MSNLYRKITQPNVVKYSVLSAMIIFLPSLILAIIIAYSFGGTEIGPNEFNLWDNYISDLGSIRYTPAPFILDIIAMITSILMIPIFLYFKVHFKEAALRNKSKTPLYVTICEILGVSFLFIGNIGLFGIGLFSEDRSSAPLYLHEVFSVIVWGGMAVAALFIGIVALNKDLIFTKIVGFFMIFTPTPVTILYAYLYLISSPVQYIFEWIMLFCIFIWLIPFCLKIIQSLDSKSSP